MKSISLMTATFKLILCSRDFPWVACTPAAILLAAMAPEYRSLSSTIWEKIDAGCDSCCPFDYQEGTGQAVAQSNEEPPRFPFYKRRPHTVNVQSHFFMSSNHYLRNNILYHAEWSGVLILKKSGSLVKIRCIETRFCRLPKWLHVAGPNPSVRRTSWLYASYKALTHVILSDPNQPCDRGRAGVFIPIVTTKKLAQSGYEPGPGQYLIGGARIWVCWLQSPCFFPSISQKWCSAELQPESRKSTL